MGPISGRRSIPEQPDPSGDGKRDLGHNLSVGAAAADRTWKP
jgi:hypothetical protein